MRYRNFTQALLLIALSACTQAAPSIEDRKERIKAMAVNASAAAIQRKEASDARLTSEGVPVNKHLPAIEDVREMKFRTKEETAWRAMALLVVAVKGEGLDQPEASSLSRASWK